jgi:hypothetical protein
MKHNHNHNCVCKHLSVKYCSHCLTVYCEGCNQEWTAKSNFIWATGAAPYYGYQTAGTGALGGTTTISIGDSSQPTNVLTSTCKHGE